MDKQGYTKKTGDKINNILINIGIKKRILDDSNILLG